jgi:hypothetical protein
MNVVHKIADSKAGSSVHQMAVNVQRERFFNLLTTLHVFSVVQ